MQLYYCAELKLMFFYSDSLRPILGQVAKEIEVYCVALYRKVTLELVESSNELELGLNFCYPVDLFSTPHKIDPRPSRNVTEEQFKKYLEYINERFQRRSM